MARVIGDNLDKLLSIPPSKWAVSQVIVFDWYDEAREGICKLEEPDTIFYFKLYANIRSGSRRGSLFLIGSFTQSEYEHLLLLLSPAGEPKQPIWIPIFDFGDRSLEESVRAKLDEVVGAVTLSDIVVETKNMIDFVNYWIKT
mgnify:CR=1 FL=1